jgi:hypothetical protein
MKKVFLLAWGVLTLAMLAGWHSEARAQGTFELITGKAFDSALPKDFYLEGNAIPTQKRNAAMLKTPAGTRALLALIDTTGYSSQIKQKYIGMIITEGKLSVCGISLGVGSYGFGLDRPAAPSNADAKFFLYNQAGEKAGECSAKKDTSLKQPSPLKVVVGKADTATLELTRYVLELKYPR